MKRGPVDKYLQGHAESEVSRLPVDIGRHKHVVCIPACAEAGSLLDTIEAMSGVHDAASALVIVVINGRESAQSSVHQSNAQAWSELQSASKAVGTSIVVGHIDGMGVMMVDRWSQGRWLPEKQGVGLARKIAGDMALALIANGLVEEPWIRMTDADVRVPQDFFSQLMGVPEHASAVIAPFEHVPEGDQQQQRAMATYDAYLQSYVDGLQRAGSPYAFHTIGSLISVRSESYASVRGMPKREAGEDFYLLNKLAKVGQVVSLDGDPIRIRGRLSDRVPFGTGAALNEICSTTGPRKEYRAYDSHVFDGLAHWLSALDRFVDRPDVAELKATIRALSEPLGTALYETLSAMGAFEAAGQASGQVSGAQLRRRLMEWNDAFRTLKLIHGLRAHSINQRPVSM